MAHSIDELTWEKGVRGIAEYRKAVVDHGRQAFHVKQFPYSHTFWISVREKSLDLRTK